MSMYCCTGGATETSTSRPAVMFVTVYSSGFIFCYLMLLAYEYSCVHSNMGVIIMKFIFVFNVAYM